MNRVRPRPGLAAPAATSDRTTFVMLEMTERSEERGPRRREPASATAASWAAPLALRIQLSLAHNKKGSDNEATISILPVAKAIRPNS